VWGGAESRQRESLILYKSFNTLWWECVGQAVQLGGGEGRSWAGQHDLKRNARTLETI
jgi:hypothetical protein